MAKLIPIVYAGDMSMTILLNMRLYCSDTFDSHLCSGKKVPNGTVQVTEHLCLKAKNCIGPLIKYLLSVSSEKQVLCYRCISKESFMRERKVCFTIFESRRFRMVLRLLNNCRKKIVVATVSQLIISLGLWTHCVLMGHLNTHFFLMSNKIISKIMSLNLVTDCPPLGICL